jgi:predicted transcriptional regulator
MDYENAISVSQKEIAEILCMKKQNVSRAIKTLRTAGVFQAEEAHVVYLATELGWKGKVQNLHKRNAEAFKECREKTAPTDADWKQMDAKIAALPKFSEAAATI